MFSKMKNIETSFQYIRIFSTFLVIVCLLISCYSLYKSFSIVSQMQNKVYLLANGKALELVASNREENIAVEARDHIKTFHELFFWLDPDEKLIKEQLSRALYLADQSAKWVYDNLKERDYYSAIISGNISQRVIVDSIHLELTTSSIHFSCFARQILIRSSSIANRSLITSGDLRTVGRSDHNSHGFLIEGWKIIENKELSVRKRN